MRRRWLALFVPFVLLVGACSGDDDDTESSTPSTVTEDTTEDTTDESASTASTEPTEETIFTTTTIDPSTIPADFAGTSCDGTPVGFVADVDGDTAKDGIALDGTALRVCTAKGPVVQATTRGDEVFDVIGVPPLGNFVIIAGATEGEAVLSNIYVVDDGELVAVTSEGEDVVLTDGLTESGDEPAGGRWGCTEIALASVELTSPGDGYWEAVFHRIELSGRTATLSPFQFEDFPDEPDLPEVEFGECIHPT